MPCRKFVDGLDRFGALVRYVMEGAIPTARALAVP